MFHQTGNSGQRCGNVLWDCITYVDDNTVRRNNELGGIDAIAISQPHYFSAAVEWSRTFKRPVYYSAEDEEWIMRFGEVVKTLDSGGQNLYPTSSSYRVGGTPLTDYRTPPLSRLCGHTLILFRFLPNDVHKIWKVLADLDFEDAHGDFMGHDTYGNSKRRLLENAKLYVKHAGYVNHAIHEETL
ncbi:hypothetical protein VTO42DRAFT_1286 [Malbranchea cinnamomea]